MRQQLPLLALGAFQAERGQAQDGAGWALRQPRHRLRGERAEARVAADGLAVVEQDDGLAVGRHLDGAQRDAFGNHVAAPALQARAEQAHAHAVGAVVHRPVAVEGVEQALPGEIADLRTEHYGQRRAAGQVGNPCGRQLARGRRATAPVQAFAVGQRLAVAVQAAEALAQHGGAAAQHLRGAEAAGRGQIGAHPKACLVETQALALADDEAAPRRQRHVVEASVQVGAAQRQADVLLGEQAEAAEGDLDHRGVRCIAEQPVGPAQGDPVGAAALADAEVAHAETAGILQGGQQAVAFDHKAHGCTSKGVSSPPRRRNSLRSTGSKRTRSPGCSRLRPSSRSNSSSGMRPIRFQPPGETEG